MDLSAVDVSLIASSSYEASVLGDRLETLLAPLAPFSLRGKKILLKPNLLSAKKGPLACTEGQMILEVSRWLRDQGALVAVGDSPAYGGCRGVLGQLGILDGLARLGIPVREFTRVAQIRLPDGLRIGLAREALECDLLVNVPRVKAHAQLRVTLAVKNCFGCVAGMRKPVLHMLLGDDDRFAVMLAGLLQVLPDALTVVDGVTAMHISGPLGGRAFSLGLLAASRNPVAIDSTLLAVLGVEPSSSPVWQACRKYSLPGTDVTTLSFPLQHPLQLRTSGFLVPASLNPIRFSLLRFARGSLRRLLLHWKLRR